MQRSKCTSCGMLILKSGLSDPYICRDCENLMIGDDSTYAYLDNTMG